MNDAGEIHMYNIATKNVGTQAGRGRKHDRSIQEPTAAPCGCWAQTQSRAVSRSTSGMRSKQAWESYGTYGAVEMTEAAGDTMDRSVRRQVVFQSPAGADSDDTGRSHADVAIANSSGTAADRTAESGKLLCSATIATSCGRHQGRLCGKVHS